MIVISPSLVLAKVGAEGANNPIIGYEQLATIDNTTADSEDADNPVSNVVNPATDLVWVSESAAEQYITVIHNRVAPIDYVGIAEHNFGTAGVATYLEGYAEVDGDEEPVWFELAAQVFQDDAPHIFRFEPQSLIGVRLKMVPNSTAPTLGHLRVGKLLVLPRPIYVGHTPLKFGQQTRVSNGRSENGKFLGRIVLGRTKATSVSLTQLPRGWYRDYMQPFVEDAEANTFFFAWRPQEFPYETGYAWLTGDAKPVNSRPEGFVDVELSIGGIA